MGQISVETLATPGSVLSGNQQAGQRQRIALARALFRDPFLVVLDEPNSNLDAGGDAALNQAIAGARARGAIVIIVAHRPSALVAVDKVLWLDGGAVRALGAKADVLPQLTGAPLPDAAAQTATPIGAEPRPPGTISARAPSTSTSPLHPSNKVRA